MNKMLPLETPKNRQCGVVDHSFLYCRSCKQDENTNYGQRNKHLEENSQKVLRNGEVKLVREEACLST